MLLRFAARNFLSLDERQEVSFVASKLKDRAEGLIEIPTRQGGEAVPLVILYGANASGKSNAIAALRHMQNAVVLSHRLGSPEGGVQRTPFALRPESKAETTSFDIDFVVDGIRYHFGYECNDLEFVSEWLYSYPEGTKRVLFDRTSPDDISFGGTLKGPKKALVSFMRRNSLFLSSAAQNNHTELLKVYSFFSEIMFNGELAVDEMQVSTGYTANDIDPRTISFLEAIGTGVVGHRRRVLPVPESFKDHQDELFDVLGRMMGGAAPPPPLPTLVADGLTLLELAHANSNGEHVYFDMARESAGTRRLLVLLRSVFRALETGSLLIVDELDASLHTQAAEALVALFASKDTNPKGAQLFATTHDTNLMHSDLLRRDEIWFAQKDSGGATHIYPLTDIHTRQADNIEKGYLQGRFGAIPFSGSAAGFLARL